MREELDLAVVGAGLVGLAAARAARRRWPEARIAVFERHPRTAAGQSGHNSGVVHSGIYYAPGSKKARLCREGRALLLDYCREEGIEFHLRGKLLVATKEEELPRLDALEARGRENGLGGLRRLDRAQIREIEPSVEGVAGLHVPEAGVIDFRAVCRSLQSELEMSGVRFRMSEVVRAARTAEGSLELRTSRRTIRTRGLLACAGLYADEVARACGASLDVRVVPFRGEYWRVKAPASDAVRGLVYPVPDPALPFLGIHLTRSVDGEVDAGPNAVLALAREGYRGGDIDLMHLAGILSFPGFFRLLRRHSGDGWKELVRSTDTRRLVADLQRLVPSLTAGDLERAPSGVRAQVVDRSGRLVDDFLFARGPRSLHVINAPSPAATASLAIAEEVVDELAGQLGW